MEPLAGLALFVCAFLAVAALGVWYGMPKCPECGSRRVSADEPHDGRVTMHCLACRHRWCEDDDNGSWG